jgi:ornithine cyclodeaminase/alanine dehydrogenase-like protein (mu-crystallin family)
MNREATLLLRRHDVARLLTMQECIVAVEHAFRLYGKRQAMTPGMLGLHGSHGAFHIKAGFLRLQRDYFAAKVNANYPQNVEQFGLPTIQGVVVLCDAENGRPLAMMDSAEITARRTAAASAVAAKYLARPKSAVLTAAHNSARWRPSSLYRGFSRMTCVRSGPRNLRTNLEASWASWFRR